jgi:serine phosphatase RsbU (regulator of sigma subunit)
MLVLYTDGVTEAANAEGEEYGEDRLVGFLRAHTQLAATALLTPLVEELQAFSPGEQADDITLVVARCRA